MGGAQPRRTTVISPATGPVWAARLMAPSLLTAALPRPWWPLQTRRDTAWRARASAREVGFVERLLTAELKLLLVADDLFLSALNLPPAVDKLVLACEFSLLVDSVS